MVKVLFIGMERHRTMYGLTNDSIAWRTTYSKIAREFDSLVACRRSAMWANMSNRWTSFSFEQGKVYDLKTKKFLGIIYSDRWYTKVGEVWYSQMLNKDGTIDSNYPKYKLSSKPRLYKQDY